jgi:hypothetical protein
VTVLQEVGFATVAVVLDRTFQFVLTGSADFQFFKFNGAPSLASITNVVAEGAPGVNFIADTGTFNGDGTGNFSFGIRCTPISPGTSCAMGGAGALPVGTVLFFAVQGATVAQLTQGNNLGNIFVADILSRETDNTGPVDVSVPGPVVGAGLPGLVAACTGLVALARRRRRLVA